MTSIFLSYARSDDGEQFHPATSFVARLHRDLTTEGFDVWFDRVSMPSRSLTFHQEIRDAVATRDRLVLVAGPKAAESLYVRQEWQFAYFEAEKIVTPILRWGEYSQVPDELRLLHCEDFRDADQYEFHLKNLIRQLAEPAPALGKLIGVPSLPAHFLSRTERLTALRDALRADLDRPVVITGVAARVGMHGMGGIGKSVLAATLSRDRKVREAFPDGIVWVGLGSLPTIADLQRRVHKDLGGDGAFQTEHEGRVKLRDILKDKGVLLILDDVWRRADVDWFDVLGPRCRAMITTRDSGLLTSLGGVHHQVELLTDVEALNLLAQAAGIEQDKLPSEAADLIAECGRLPLAVALCGGLIRHGFAWAKVLEQLRNSRIDRIKDPHPAKVEHQNIWNAIDVSVKFLSADEQARFLELAVFPPDETTPIAALQTLWSHTASFDDWDTDALVIKLSQRSLLQLTTLADGKSISLHALVYDYVHRAAGDETVLHQSMLEAYRKKCPEGWHVDPPNDGYFFTHLRHHLIAVGRVGELADLLRELRWLEAKARAGLAADLLADFERAVSILSAAHRVRPLLELLGRALGRELNFLSRRPAALFQTLWNLCWWHDTPETDVHFTEPPTGPPLGLATLLEAWRSQHRGLWLRTLRPPVSALNGPALATLRGHDYYVEAVAFSPDGSWLATAGGTTLSRPSQPPDFTVRLWDATGRLDAELQGHQSAVHALAFAPDGWRLASIGEEVILWDVAATRILARSEVPKPLRARCLYFAPDGNQILVVTANGILLFWDAFLNLRQQALDLPPRTEPEREMPIRCAVVSADRRRVITSWGREQFTIRVWDADTGRLLDEFGAQSDPVDSLALSPDGRRLAVGAGDRGMMSLTARTYSVRVWDMATKELVAQFDGHPLPVGAVAYSPCGDVVVAGGSGIQAECSAPLHLWPLSGTRRPEVWKDHQIAIRSLAFAPDGRHLASTAWDGTARLWSMDPGRRSRRPICAGDEIRVVRFAPGGRLLATSAWDDHTIRVWDAHSGVQLRELVGHQSLVRALAFAPNPQLLASAGGSKYRSRDATVRLWDLANNRVKVLHTHDPEMGWENIAMTSVAFSDDGQLLVAGQTCMTSFIPRPSVLRIWAVRTGRQVDRIGSSPMGGLDDGRAADFLHSYGFRTPPAQPREFGRWRVEARSSETAFLRDGVEVAWLPDIWTDTLHLAVDPSRPAWAYGLGEHLALLQIEDES